MPKYFCTSIKCIVFKKQMLQAASTDLFNLVVPKASECLNIILSSQIKPVKVNLKLNWQIFIFCILGTNGLI